MNLENALFYDDQVAAKKAFMALYDPAQGVGGGITEAQQATEGAAAHDEEVAKGAVTDAT